MPASIREIRSLGPVELGRFVEENLQTLLEAEALAVLGNPHCTAHHCDLVARTQRLTALYSVRLRIVGHRATPRAHAIKFVSHIYWPDLLRLSVDVTVPAVVRRSIDARMLLRAPELATGERIASARSCSAALVKHFLADTDERIFAALLVNPRLREDELVAAASSDRITPQQLSILSADSRWSQRRAIRRAIAMNPSTPPSVAALQLRHLPAADLRGIYRHPRTSVYLKRCIERLEETGGKAGRR